MGIDETAKSSVISAIAEGRLDDVKQSLVLANLSKQEQFYCLFHAFFHNRKQIASYFLQNGFEFISSGQSCPSLFRLPVFNHNIELIDMLLKKSVYNIDTCSVSSLLFLAFSGQVNAQFARFFESLLDKASDDALKNLLKSSLTPASPDATQPAILLETFLEYSSAIIKLDDFSALLYLAFSRGNAKIVKLLLSRICEDDLMDLLETILTDTAFDDWRPQLFQILLDYGSADIKIVSENYVRPLFGVLNRCVHYPQVHLISNCTLGRIFNEEDVSATEILVQHAIKMKAANLYKEQLVVIIFKNPETVCDYQRKCEFEIEEMKFGDIGETGVTYYDILSMDLNRLALLTKNNQIAQRMKADYHKVRFPVYSSMISNLFEKGGIRKGLLEQSINVCHSLLGRFSDLPYELIEKIFGYLENKELRILSYTRT